MTVNRFCGSSMQAIHMAAGAIQMGAGEAFICAGVESMSRVPMMGFNPMPNPALANEIPGAYMGMGETAENVARRYQISRARAGGVRRASQRRPPRRSARRAGSRTRSCRSSARRARVDQDGCIRAGHHGRGPGRR